MPCFSPLAAYRSPEVNPATGKRQLVFSSKGALIEGSAIKLPCGQCAGCRSDRARANAIRCAHEAKLSGESCFVTLTYDDASVPADYSIKLRDWQLFMKRLRFKAGGVRIRYFACGEYGENTLRPHYHALLFGWDFPDKKLYTERRGNRVYKSDMLEELWPFGFHELGAVTMKSAGYCARYVMKKMTGELVADHYYRRSPIDGQMHHVAPEFATMSLKPGLGSAWFDRYASDAFPSDFIVVDGRKMRPPQYYLRKLAESQQEPIKRARKRHAAKPAVRAKSTPERLKAREAVHAERMSRLVRSL